MDRHSSHPRRPGQCDRPHTRRAEKRLGNLNKVVINVFCQYKQWVAWRNSAISGGSHARELLGGVQSIYFRTGVTVIMARFVTPSCRGRGHRMSATRPRVAEDARARGGEHPDACVPVAHPRCSVACNASPPSHQGCRAPPSRPYCRITHALSTACLSGTALAFFHRHNTKTLRAPRALH